MAMEIEVDDSAVSSSNASSVAQSLASQPGEGAIAAGVDAAAAMINGDGELNQAAAPVNQDGVAVAYPVAADPEPEQSPTLADDPTHNHEAIELARENAERAFEIELAEAKEAHSALALERSEVEVQLKDIKADEKAALKNVQNLIKRGPNYPKKIETQQQKIESAVENDKSTKSAIVVDDPNADQTWKLIPTSQVIDGIKGMGKKKAEAIIELAPTLGDLEELRAAAGKAFKPFKDVLPKGVGGGMADEIEERIWVVMRDHKKALDSASGATSAADSQPGEEASEVTQASEPTTLADETDASEVGVEQSPESDDEPAELADPEYFDVDDL